MNVKIVSKSGIIPSYETPGSAGFDIRAYNDNYADGEFICTIKPGEQVLIHTGLFFEIPVGFELQIRPRSGLVFKNRIKVANSPGTIDSDYRGELKVIMENNSSTDYDLHNGDRIAQGIIARVEQATFEIVDSLSETIRGEGGFGSTGVK